MAEPIPSGHYEVEKIVKRRIRDNKVSYRSLSLVVDAFFTRNFSNLKYIEIFQVEYYLKWIGYNNRANTWEPEENLDCDEMLIEFERSMAKFVLGKFKLFWCQNLIRWTYELNRQFSPIFSLGVGVSHNGEIMYIISSKDRNEPTVVPATRARIFSKKLLFDFLLKKIKFEGLVLSVGRPQLTLLDSTSVPNGNPEVVCM